MSLVARDRVLLQYFGDMLHDLYFPLPSHPLLASATASPATSSAGISASVAGPAPVAAFAIDLSDRDHVIAKKRIYTFRLAIGHITALQLDGDWLHLPPYGCQFNKFDFNDVTSQLRLICQRPLSILFSLSSLHVELDQPQ